MTTYMETHSRPWQYTVHAYVDEVELRDWSQPRLELFKRGIEAIRSAIAYQEQDEES